MPCRFIPTGKSSSPIINRDLVCPGVARAVHGALFDKAFVVRNIISRRRPHLGSGAAFLLHGGSLDCDEARLVPHLQATLITFSMS
jgi:hypothetical protein